MKFLSTFLVLILCYSSVQAQPATRQPIPPSHYDTIISTNILRCGYFTWPPFLSQDAKTRQMEGISNDIMQGIGQILDLKIEWTTQVGIADFIDDLQSDKFDAMCISNWPQSKRFKQTLATTPLYYTSLYPVVRADDTRLDISYNPLKNSELKLGVIAGDATETMVQKLFPSSPRDTLANSANYMELLTALISKQTDVVFLDKSVIYDFMKKNPDQIKIPDLRKPVFNYPEYLYVKKGEIETKLMLDNAIQLLRENGDMQRILNKYETSTSVYPLETYSAP